MKNSQGAAQAAAPRRPLHAREVVRIVRVSLVAWFNDDAPSMGAAIAFYTLFAIAPILLIIMSAAGAFVRPDIVQNHVLVQVQLLLGARGAEAVRDLLISDKYGARGGWSKAAEVVALFIAATSVFAELQNALHRIWRTPPRGVVQGLWQFLRARLLSFGLVLGIGFLMLVSLIASAGLEGLGSLLGFAAEWRNLTLAGDALLGFLLSAALFAMIFKYVPRENILWSDVWTGSFVTAALFTAGKWAIVIYLGRVAFASAYGVAGSFLVLLLWVYYSAQIFLFGAEFTYNLALARPISLTSR